MRCFTIFEKMSLINNIYIFGFLCRSRGYFISRFLLLAEPLLAVFGVFLRRLLQAVSFKKLNQKICQLYNFSGIFCFLGFADAFYYRISPAYLLSFGVQIFLLGLVGIGFNKRSFISLLLNIEVMFLGISIVFISFLGDTPDQAYAAAPLLILSIAACETALGLSIIIFMYRQG
jgi:NADH-quinone oxidoreductase subunit K